MTTKRFAPGDRVELRYLSCAGLRRNHPRLRPPYTGTVYAYSRDEEWVYVRLDERRIPSTWHSSMLVPIDNIDAEPNKQDGGHTVAEGT